MWQKRNSDSELSKEKTPEITVLYSHKRSFLHKNVWSHSLSSHQPLKFANICWSKKLSWTFAALCESSSAAVIQSFKAEKCFDSFWGSCSWVIAEEKLTNRNSLSFLQTVVSLVSVVCQWVKHGLFSNNWIFQLLQNKLQRTEEEISSEDRPSAHQ